MRIRYKAYEVAPVGDGDGLLYRPLVRARFTGSRRSRSFWALLDTGSDESYITQEMADFLGVVASHDIVSRAESAAGFLNVRYGEIGIEMSAGGESYAWRSVVGVVDEPWSEAIFGHRGVLEFFDATFLGADKIAELTANRSWSSVRSP